MRTITQKIDLYKFNELSEEIQEKLIEYEIKYTEEIYCETLLLADMKDKAIELLQKYFKKNADFKAVYYDLSYTQGSGAMIAFDLIYYNKYLKVSNFGNYTHEKSFIVENDYLLTDKQCAQLTEKIVKMNIELKKYGYELIENSTSRNEAIDFLNEHEYTIDGEIFN